MLARLKRRQQVPERLKRRQVQGERLRRAVARGLVGRGVGQEGQSMLLLPHQRQATPPRQAAS